MSLLLYLFSGISLWAFIITIITCGLPMACFFLLYLFPQHIGVHDTYGMFLLVLPYPHAYVQGVALA